MLKGNYELYETDQITLEFPFQVLKWYVTLETVSYMRENLFIKNFERTKLLGRNKLFKNIINSLGEI